MKKLLSFAVLLSVLLLFTGCRGKTYAFHNPVDKIERIEIVSAENSLEFTIIKTLSEAEKNDFLEQFQKLKFYTYYLGDPMAVHGNAVKITYQDGDYEMICHHWSEYVQNDDVLWVWTNCDEESFNELLNTFLGNAGDSFVC